MSRLSSDVQGFGGFSQARSSDPQHLCASSGDRLLFYLEWKLAVCVLVILPGVVFCVRYFSGKIRCLATRDGAAGSRFKPIFRVSLFRLTHQSIFFRGSDALTPHVRVEVGLSNHHGANGSMVGRKPDHQTHAWAGENRPARFGRLLGDYGPLELGIVTCVSGLSGLCVRSAQFLSTANLELQMLSLRSKSFSTLQYRPRRNVGVEKTSDD